jgi:hypothetical protein
MAAEFHDALRRQGCDAQLIRVANRNHNSVLLRAIEADDPVARAMVEFVRQHAAGR